MRAFPWSVSLCAAIVTSAARGHAQPQGPGPKSEDRAALVSIDVTGCTGIRASEVRRIAALELELHSLHQRDVRAPTRVTVDCHNPFVLLTLEDALTNKALSRRVDVSSTPPELRARLLGVAVSELVVASWIELELTPEPALAPMKAPAGQQRDALAAVQATRRKRSGISELAAEASLRAFTTTGALWGAGVRFDHDTPAPYGFSLVGNVEFGEKRTSLGVLSATTASVAAVGTLHGRLGAANLRAGAGLRTGAALLVGDPASASTALGASHRGFWCGPLLSARSSLELFRPLALSAGLEAGYALLPVRGFVDSGERFEVAGAWLAGSLAIGAILP